LVVALGSSHHYFGKDGWSRLAPGLKTIEDAIEMRKRILLAFEQAEWQSDPARIRTLLTFVVVGGGPTGVELAGALAEIARDTLAHEFRSIDPSHSRILLVEGTPRILSAYPPDLSQKAVQSLQRLGVEVRLGTIVTDIQPNAIVVRTGEETEHIPTATVLWAAGVQASPFSKVLAEATGATLDRAGRVMVEPDLSVPGHPEILVIGDLAHFAHGSASPLPGVAPVAMQQGAYAARLIQERLRGKTLPPFQYRDRGTMATIGRNAAVAAVFGFRFAGYVAWLAWLCIHLVQLVQFENRILVFAQWAWNYFTFNRAARLITNLPRANRPDATDLD
jgi:NADH dehydrogenase